MSEESIATRQEEGILGRVLNLLLLVLFVGGGAVALFLIGDPPHLPTHIPSWDEFRFTLQGSEIPAAALIYLTTSLAWLLLGYLAVTILLRIGVDLVVALGREHAFTHNVKAMSDRVTLPLVRTVVDGLVVTVMVVRLLGPDLGPAPVAAAPLATVQMVPQPDEPTNSAPTITTSWRTSASAEITATSPGLPASAKEMQANEDGRTIHYLVKRGDTLQKIAQRFLGNEGEWVVIWDANRGHQMDDQEVFSNPDHIEPSWELTIPLGGKTDHGVYVVKPGDALWSIAEHELGDGTRWREIWALNEGRVMADGRPFSDPRLIEPGWRLLLPIASTSHISPSSPPLTSPHPAPIIPHPATRPRTRPAPQSPAHVDIPVPTPSAPSPAPLAPRAPEPTPAPAPTSAPTPVPAPATKVFPSITLPDGRIVAATFAVALLGLLASLRRRRGQSLDQDGLSAAEHPALPGRFLAALRQRCAAELETDKVAIVGNRLVSVLNEWGEPGAHVVSCLEGRKSLTFTLPGDPAQGRRLEELAPIIRTELQARTQVKASEEGSVTVTVSGISVSGMLAASRSPDQNALPLLIPIGATSDQRVLHLNLAETGPLLIAGASGGDAREFLRDLTLILAAQAHPRQLTLALLGDPRGVLGQLADLPHLGFPIVDVDDTVRMEETLAVLQAELGQRIGLCQDENAPSLSAYNTAQADQNTRLPYLVVGIADLAAVLAVPGAAGILATLAHDGPTYGILPLVATTEPETLPDPVLDAFPTRLALRLANESQSLRILGEPGAEALAPNGEVQLRLEDRTSWRLRGLRIAPEEVAECVRLMAVALGARPLPTDEPQPPKSEEDDQGHDDGMADTYEPPMASSDDIVHDVDPIERGRSDDNRAWGGAHVIPGPRGSISTNGLAEGAHILRQGSGADESAPPASSPPVSSAPSVGGLLGLPLTEEEARRNDLLRIYTLGRYRVFRGETEITGTTAKHANGKGKVAFRAKARELLAYFVTLRDRDLGRERIQEDLWPDAEPDQCQQVFHNTLWTVRRALNGQGHIPEKLNVIVEQDGTYRLAQDLIWIDAQELEACVERAEELESAEPAQAALLRQRAVTLYQGEYLDHEYAEWASAEQLRLRHIYLRALKKLADSYVAHRQPERAIGALVDAIALEPFEEALQRKLMHLYAATSDWQALVRQYEQLEAMLQREMHIAPDQKTRELYQRLLASRNGTTERSPSPPRLKEASRE